MVTVVLPTAMVPDVQNVILVTAIAILVVKIIMRKFFTFKHHTDRNVNLVRGVKRRQRAVHLLHRAPPLVPNQLGRVHLVLNVSVLLFLFVAKYIEG